MYIVYINETIVTAPQPVQTKSHLKKTCWPIFHVMLNYNFLLAVTKFFLSYVFKIFVSGITLVHNYNFIHWEENIIFKYVIWEPILKSAPLLK